MFVTRAAEILLGGGIIAYPTEGVFGLGCLPDDIMAVARLLHIKKRAAAKGLILIASSIDQLDGWVSLPDGQSIPSPDPAHPVTWVVPPGPRVPAFIQGENIGLAVRLTTNPVAAAICAAVASPIVSTSANLSGKPAARNRFVLRRQFGARVDYIVPGNCGPASGASEIRDLTTGKVLRPR
ncbi:MAG: Sua5/YciO/YrdC/YwlC family protein [Gammaproteobacteria bacterium]|nr:Sua5/YciO/YrdC/YwlC family protein [Gammaproteobacteria bacterium]MBT8109576.1 Sua5/YciO/YrdC/YwlC family protein [Gammaproteobacteria bacterium]NND47265.1 tRNA threonylcarbamoyladenosine biosynthesis protein RimN [Woeseiaceae bacterium]NNL44278.1 tRNA threonylcarbamoyladenosine biosynthesis protein RimN [Woeseiaceae bacterium]